MKLQFTTKTLLLITATVAIALGGALGWIQTSNLTPPPYAQVDLMTVVKIFPCTLPLWLPIIFTAYAVGRRSLTVPMVVFFAIAELLSVGVSYGTWDWVKDL